MKQTFVDNPLTSTTLNNNWELSIKFSRYIYEDETIKSKLIGAEQLTDWFAVQVFLNLIGDLLVRNSFALRLDLWR